jgi:eukaryotic-like serine/threonine-protein kinase
MDGSSTSGALKADLVGRDNELQRLLATFDSVRAGRGRVCLIAGEPGIGKTYLSEHFGHMISDSGVRIALGRCWEGDSAPAYWPWTQIFRSLNLSADLPSPEELPVSSSRPNTSSPRIGDSFSWTEFDQTLLGETVFEQTKLEPQRFRLFESLSSNLRAESVKTPILIIFDDYHCADSGSALLLKFIANDIRSSRVMIIATYREVEAQLSPLVGSVLTELAREAEAIRLVGISADDANNLVSRVVSETLDPSLVDQLYRSSEGNPFFFAEMVRLVVSENRDQKSLSDAVVELVLPDTVRSTIMRRIALASRQARNLLAAASVVGREFELLFLGEVLHLSGEDIWKIANEGTRYHIIREIPDQYGRFEFRHELFREALYQALPRFEKQQLHKRFAEQIENTYKNELDDHLNDLARHYARAVPAVPIDRPISYAVKAANRAVHLLAYEEAVRLYRLALKVSEGSVTVDHRLRCTLLLGLGAAQFSSGEFEASRQVFDEAVREASLLSDAESLALALLGRSRGPTTPAAPDLALISTLENSLETLRDQYPFVTVRLMARLAQELYWSDKLARSRTLSAKAVELARTLSENSSLAQALYGHHVALSGPDTTQERLQISAEMVTILGNDGDPTSRMFAHHLRIEDLLEVGNIPALDRELARYSQLLRESRLQFGIPDTLRAMRALLDGRFVEAEALALKGYGSFHRRREAFASQVLATQIALVRREQGRLIELAPTIKSFVVEYPDLIFAKCGLAACYAETGQPDLASLEFEQLAALGFEAFPRNSTWLASMVLLSEVCSRLKDGPRAKLLYELLLPYANLNATLNAYASYGAVGQYLGMLAGINQQFEKAACHFEDALLLNRKMGARPWIARTQYEYASVLLKRGRGADAMNADLILGSALAAAKSLGMTTLCDSVLALKGSIPLHSAGLSRIDNTVTFLFSDIVGSTVLTERLGDIRAQELIQIHNGLIREQLKMYEGSEVKTLGDGFMIAFSSARKAVLCAIAIQRAFFEYSNGHPDQGVSVRLGLHIGEAVQFANDFYGKAVILAARIGSTASGGEILVSSSLKEIVETAGDLIFDNGRDVVLKGLAGTFRLYAVSWRHD